MGSFASLPRPALVDTGMIAESVYLMAAAAPSSTAWSGELTAAGSSAL
jgi:hypothetical protein